jgi:hypothetical protein
MDGRFRENFEVRFFALTPDTRVAFFTECNGSAATD